jgi:hypothetical protein
MGWRAAKDFKVSPASLAGAADGGAARVFDIAQKALVAIAMRSPNNRVRGALLMMFPLWSKQKVLDLGIVKTDLLWSSARHQ